MEPLIFTAKLIAPVFLVTFVGIVLKRADLMDDDFMRKSSKLAFSPALPVMIFTILKSAGW